MTTGGRRQQLLRPDHESERPLQLPDPLFVPEVGQLLVVSVELLLLGREVKVGHPGACKLLRAVAGAHFQAHGAILRHRDVK